MEKRVRIILLLLLIVVMACQPEPDNEKLYDQFVVYTNYQPNTDYKSYTTYSIATDTIGFNSNRSTDTLRVTPTHGQYPRTVIQRIVNNLNAAGYTRVGKNENPDLRVNVAIVNNINLFQQVIYPTFYDPWNYYGYGSYFYYNYPLVATYSNNTAALIIEITDFKNPTPDNKLKVIWTAFMGDLVTVVDLTEQSIEGIDRAFNQSPYLTK